MSKEIPYPEFPSGISLGTIRTVSAFTRSLVHAELEKLAVKDNADVTRVIKKSGGFIPGDMKRELGGSDPSNLGYQYASMGGKILALEPGEEFQSFQSNRPSPAFTGFLAALERDIAQGVLPYEFVSDPTKAGSASIRLISAKAGRVFGKYQTVMINTLCNPTWGYVIGQAIANGELPDDPCWNEVSWTTPKSVTVDAGREAANDREDLRLGLLSFSEIYNQRGMNFEEEAEIKAQNVRYLLDLSKTYGVPFETLSNIPHIVKNGAAWFKAMGVPGSTGTRPVLGLARGGWYACPCSTMREVMRCLLVGCSRSVCRHPHHRERRHGTLRLRRLLRHAARRPEPLEHR